MPISFLTPAQRETYGRYAASPTPDQLSRFFHLSDDELIQIVLVQREMERSRFPLVSDSALWAGIFKASGSTDPMC